MYLLIECMRLSNSSKVSELLYFKFQIFQGLCMVVRLMIKSLGSDGLQDTFENRHWLDLFKLSRSKTRHCHHSIYTALHTSGTYYLHKSADWIKKRYRHRGGKGMWLEGSKWMIAFEWMLIGSVEFFQERGECKFPLGNWETCGFPDVLCAWLENGIDWGWDGGKPVSGMWRNLNVVLCIGGTIRHMPDRIWRIREGSRIEDELMYSEILRRPPSIRRIIS